MTLIEGLKELKAQGISKLVGMVGVSDIDVYIENAEQRHADDLRWADVSCHKYSLDHENDNYMVVTADGHHIIVTTYGKADNHPFDMATYSDYETEEEMSTAFDEWEIAQQAAKIADEKEKQDSSFPREAWVLVATMELRAAYKAAHEAFGREY